MSSLELDDRTKRAVQGRARHRSRATAANAFVDLDKDVSAFMQQTDLSGSFTDLDADEDGLIAAMLPEETVPQTAVPAPPADPPMTPAQPAIPQPADSAIEAVIEPQLLRHVVEQAAEQSERLPYGWVSLDRGFKTKGHPYHQRAHEGLRYGIGRFSQETGTLGALLLRMNERDGNLFERRFGPDSSFPEADPEELLRILNAGDPNRSEDYLDQGGRNARVQPVSGLDLWEEPWAKKFKAAADDVTFRAAQNQTCAEVFLAPNIHFAGQIGLLTERGLAILTERSIVDGIVSARTFVAEAAGPFLDTAKRREALVAVTPTGGDPSVAGFQAARPDLERDGNFGPLTHAALMQAVRALGESAPLLLPSYEESLDALLRAAESLSAGAEAARILTADTLSDVSLTLGEAA